MLLLSVGLLASSDIWRVDKCQWLLVLKATLELCCVDINTIDVLDLAKLPGKRAKSQIVQLLKELLIFLLEQHLLDQLFSLIELGLFISCLHLASLKVRSGKNFIRSRLHVGYRLGAIHACNDVACV